NLHNAFLPPRNEASIDETVGKGWNASHRTTESLLASALRFPFPLVILSPPMPSRPPRFAVPTRALRIAVIGSGISGMAAAWLLSHRHSVVLFEKAARLGGHSNTVSVPTP